DVWKLSQRKLDLLGLRSTRELQQKRRNPVGLKVSWADIPSRMLDRRATRRRRLGPRFRARSAAECDQVGECGEGQKVGLVEWTYTGFAEAAENAERLPAETEHLAGLARETTADDYIASADWSGMMVLEPAQNSEI